MKKLVLAVAPVLLLTLHCIFIPLHPEVCETDKWDTSPLNSNAKTVAVWISYLDLQQIFCDYCSSSMDEIFSDLLSIGATDVFLQVTAFGDALWNSKVYPSSEITVYSSSGIPERFLDDFIAAAKTNAIEVHAWMNPFRLWPHAKEGYQPFLYELSERGMLKEFSGGYYLDPASEHTDTLLKTAITELLDLGFAGIHFDDYFYPTTEASFDNDDFGRFKEAGGELSLDEFRRQNIDRVVSECYEAVKAHNSEAVFGISPDASVERCYAVHYCDVAKWCAESGYIDYICPQIYYGFCNESMPYKSVLEQWIQISCNKEMLIGLAFSKAGQSDGFAGSGEKEWINNDDVIARQAETALVSEHCAGIALFRFCSLFSPAEEQIIAANAELCNLKAALGVRDE